MKLKLILITFIGLTFFAIGSVWWIHATHSNAITPPNKERSFEVKGWIRSIATDQQTVTIEHDDIPDFMPSMTMPFPIHDTRILNHVAIGDRVNFRLMINRKEAWISQIQKIENTGTAPLPLSSPSGQLVFAGEEVPNFSLADQDGHVLQLRDFRGKAVVLTFIFTRCPLPNFCPMMSINFKTLHETLKPRLAGKYHLLSISFDSKFDTPEVLKNYAHLFTSDNQDWSFATGTPEQIQAVTSIFGLYYEPKEGSITHDLRTALIGPDGKLVHVWKSNQWKPSEVQDMLEETIIKSQTKQPSQKLSKT